MHDTPSNLPYPETTSASAFQTAQNGSDGAPPESSRQTAFVEGPPNLSEFEQRVRNVSQNRVQQRVRENHDLSRPLAKRALSARSDDLGGGSEATGNEGAGAERPTGLVLEGRLEPRTNPEPWTLRDDPCPLADAHSFDRTTGEIVWRPTCKNARCRRCSRQVSAQTFALARRALEPIDHVRFITLTQAPEGWEETRHALKMWIRNLRRNGITMNALNVAERGSETGMKHLHVIQWGKYIPKNLLDESWVHGSTNIQAARAATDYLSKGVLKYVAKELDGGDNAIEEHMNLNGGRAAHWTRGFFAGQSRDGYRQSNPLPGIYFVGTEMPDRREETPF